MNDLFIVIWLINYSLFSFFFVFYSNFLHYIYDSLIYKTKYLKHI